jgi:hypothetical protein
VLVQRLFGFLVNGLEVEDDLFVGSGERVGRLVLVVEVDDQALTFFDAIPLVALASLAFAAGPGVY